MKKTIHLYLTNFKSKNLEDSFEQKKYEAIVKRNFAESMQEKLILKLKTL